MRALYCGCGWEWILYYERGYCEREKRELQQVCCRLYPFILLDNKKEGPGNFFGVCSPHWVSHVYVCLYYIVYIMCFISTFVLFYCSTILFFYQDVHSWWFNDWNLNTLHLEAFPSFPDQFIMPWSHPMVLISLRSDWPLVISNAIHSH